MNSTPTFKYVIISRNQLDGHIVGHFKDLFGLFLVDMQKDQDGHHIQWTEKLADAKKFDFMQEARDYARDIWGYDFTNRSFMYMAVHEDAFKASESTHRDAEEAAKRVTTVTAGRRPYPKESN